MKKILVTGCNGLTGRYFVGYLKKIRLDIKIIGLDIKDNAGPHYERLAYIKCNLLNKKRVESVIQKELPDYIFHFAGINFSTDYKKLLQHNVFSTFNLLEAVLKSKKGYRPRILVIGSAAEYGIVPMNKQPISERENLRPLTPYGVTKEIQDFLVLRYCGNYGLYIVIARSFNIIGPGQPDNLVCGSLAKQVRQIQKSRQGRGQLIAGNLYTKRDFVDIRDVVRAYWMLLESKKDIAGEVFNIASGKAHSVKDIIDIFSRYSNKKITVKQKKTIIRKNDIPYQRADIGKIKKTIKWIPEISFQKSLKDMLEADKQ